MAARIDLTVQIPGQPQKRNAGSIRLMKPNYALLTLTGDYPLVTLASDGHSIYIVSDPTRYSVTNTEAHGENIETPWWALPMRFFFTQSAKPFGPDSPPWTSSQQVGAETIGNERYNVIEVAGEKPRPYVGNNILDTAALT